MIDQTVSQKKETEEQILEQDLASLGDTSPRFVWRHIGTDASRHREFGEDRAALGFVVNEL